MAERAQQAGPRGHRTSRYPGEVCIEAWAPTREQCVAEAVLALVESFARVAGSRPLRTVPFEVTATSDEDLLAQVLDEVMDLVEDADEIPIDAEVEDADGGLDIRLTVAAVDSVELIGRPPSAGALEAVRFGRGSDAAGGWHCQAVLDD